jgi:hypothetical protein
MRVALAAIELDSSIQCRVSINTDAVQDYADDMLRGVELPPVELVGSAEKCWPADGWHRILAAKQNGHRDIAANLHPGGRLDALRIALGANAAQGLRRTNADKRRAVEIALREFGSLTNRAIAELCGVSDMLVGSLKPRQVQESCTSTSTGRDGKQYPARRSSAAPSPASTPTPVYRPEPVPQPVATRENVEPYRAPAPSVVPMVTKPEPTPVVPAPQEAPQPARMDVHFSSESAEHYTPKHVVDAVVRAMGGIDLDPCSNSTLRPNVPADRVMTASDDGLSAPWFGRVYMNPPYGSAISIWVEKLASEYENGDVSEAIALVPARTDTAWWRRLFNYPICYVRGRLTFIGNNAPAPFPSALVYLGRNVETFCEAFEHIGDVAIRWAPGMAHDLMCPHGVSIADACECCDVKERREVA